MGRRVGHRAGFGSQITSNNVRHDCFRHNFSKKYPVDLKMVYIERRASRFSTICVYYVLVAVPRLEAPDFEIRYLGYCLGNIRADTLGLA